MRNRPLQRTKEKEKTGPSPHSPPQDDHALLRQDHLDLHHGEAAKCRTRRTAKGNRSEAVNAEEDA